MQPQTAKAPDVSVQDLADTTHVDSENAAYKNADGLSWGRTEESRRDHSENRINRLPKRSSLFARQAHDLGRAFARALMASSSDCRLPGKDHLSRLDETVRIKVFFLELGDGFPPILFWIARLAQTVDESLAGTGIPKEDRAFSPHLTLAGASGGSGSPKWRKERLTLTSNRLLSLSFNFYCMRRAKNVPQSSGPTRIRTWNQGIMSPLLCR